MHFTHATLLNAVQKAVQQAQHAALNSWKSVQKSKSVSVRPSDVRLAVLAVIGTYGAK